jgi:hypothetical protein
MPVPTIVWGSTFPGISNPGADLALSTRLIPAGAKEQLRHYAYTGVDAVYDNLTKMDLPVLTIGLVDSAPVIDLSSAAGRGAIRQRRDSRDSSDGIRVLYRDGSGALYTELANRRYVASAQPRPGTLACCRSV